MRTITDSSKAKGLQIIDRPFYILPSMPIHDVAGVEDRELTIDAINQYLRYTRMTNLPTQVPDLSI